MSENPPDNQSSLRQDQPKRLLDRAFNGPETGSPANKRTSWLEDQTTTSPAAAERDPADTPTEPSEPVETDQKSGLLRLAALAAIVILAFVAGYFSRQTSTEPTEVASANSPVATNAPSTSTPSPTSAPTTTLLVPEPEPSADPPSAVISFERGTSTITDVADEAIAAFLEAQPADATIVLVGSGDTDADGPLNDALGQLRAQTVSDRFESLGVTSESLVVATNRAPDLTVAGTVLVLSR